MKYAFGLPLDQVCPPFFLPSIRGLYSISDSRIGLKEATTIVDLSKDTKEAKKPIAVLYEGIGNSSWCFATALGASGQVWAVDSDEDSHILATANARRANFDRRIANFHMNSYTFLDDSVKYNRRFRAVFLDPPWPEDDFVLTHINAPMEAAISQSTELTPVIGFRLPGEFPIEPVVELGSSLGRKTVIHAHHIQGHPAHFDTKAAYLIPGEGFSVSQLTLEKPTDNSTWTKI